MARIGLNGQWQAIFAPKGEDAYLRTIFAPKGEDAYSLLQLMRGGASLGAAQPEARLLLAFHRLRRGSAYCRRLAHRKPARATPVLCLDAVDYARMCRLVATC